MLEATHGSHTYPYRPCFLSLSLSLSLGSVSIPNPSPCSVPLVPVIGKSIQGCSQQCMYAHSTYNNALSYKISSFYRRGSGYHSCSTLSPLACSFRSNLVP